MVTAGLPPTASQYTRLAILVRALSFQRARTSAMHIHTCAGAI